DGCVWSDGVDPCVQKTPPIVGHDFVERVYDVVEGVRLHHRRGVLPAVKTPAEIVKREFALAARSDEHVGFEPDQRTFVVVIDATAIIAPSSRRRVRELDRDCGIDERTPLTS